MSENEDFEIKKEVEKEKAKERIREKEKQKIDIGENIGEFGFFIFVLLAIYLVFGEHAGSFKNKLSEKADMTIKQIQEWTE